MPACHICGAPIQTGAGERRKLRTGTNVSGMAFTSRPIVDWTINSVIKGRPAGIRNSYAVRTVCNSCARQLDVRQGRQNKTLFVLLLATSLVVLGVFVIGR